ncbi:HPP family protein [Methanosphaera sp.]
MNIHENKQFITSVTMTLIIVFIMFASSEILHESEILFPEIAAICIGYLVYKPSWNIDSKRILTYMTICAIIGVLIVEYTPLPLWQQLSIAFIIGQIILAISKTGLAPMLSAIILPVLLQSHGYIYPISTIILTSLVIIFHNIEIKKNLKTKQTFNKQGQLDKQEYILITLRILLIIVLTYITCKINLNFIIAPPLIVAFVEFSKRKSKLRKNPLKIIIILPLIATIGCICRYIITQTYHLPLTIASIIAITITIIIIDKTKTYIPPIGAICLLTMIIPETELILFPIEILIGTIILMTFTKIIYKTNLMKEK